jgi:hypothetical protein
MKYPLMPMENINAMVIRTIAKAEKREGDEM